MKSIMKYQENVVSIRVPLRETDFINGARLSCGKIVTVIEEARVRASEELTGSAPSQSNPRVVRSLSARFGDLEINVRELDVRVWINKVGNTSYEVTHEVLAKEKCCAVVHATIVRIEPATRLPKKLTDLEKKKLKKYFHKKSKVVENEF